MMQKCRQKTNPCRQGSPWKAAQRSICTFEDLPYKEEEVHYGWLNGDIDYAINAPYFTILFEDEDDSEQYGDQVNIGVITTPLSEIAALEGSYDVRIELAEQ